MAEARQSDEWDRMSLLCSLIYNSNIDPKKGKPAKPWHFNPFAKPPKPKPAEAVGIEILRHIFVPDSLPQNQGKPVVNRLIGGGSKPAATEKNE